MTETTEDLAPAEAGATIPQWSWARILVVWALATVPMGVGAWIVAPRLAESWDDGNGLLRAVLIALTVGLAWQAVIVAVVVRREVGSWEWASVSKALWLVKPVSPRSGRAGGRVWWMLLPWLVAAAVAASIPNVGEVAERNLGKVLETADAQAFFEGNWGWFLLAFVMLLLNTVVGEELLFRGVLLPRMQKPGGKLAWLWNAVLHTLYHVHQPWAMPGTLVASSVFAYTTQRYRSAWFGIAVHSGQTVIITVLLLGLVLGLA